MRRNLKADRMMTRKSFSLQDRPPECGQIVHGDVCDPMHVGSLSGARYFLLLKDDYSHYRRIIFIKCLKSIWNEKLVSREVITDRAII